jgi:hypothetical protein
MLEHVLVLERSDRVPYIRLPYGDPGFESVSLQRRVGCEPDDHAGLSPPRPRPMAQYCSCCLHSRGSLDGSAREASLLDILDRLLRLLLRACRIAGGSNRETQLRGFTNRGVSR